MAITREQKENIVETGKKDLKESGVLLFTDYKGINVDEISTLRKTLREANAKLKVLKKRLLRIILQDSGIKIDPTKFDGQVATVFAKGDISDVAGPLYKFSKEHETFEILGGVDIPKKEEISREMIVEIGMLPPRDTLIANVVGSIAAPLRGLMHVLNEKAKQ